MPTRLVLDTQHTNPVAGAQADWLAKALAARQDQQFLFICYHYPAYGTTKAPRGGLPIDNPLSIAIRQHWMPHWEKYGVTAVFENDHHNFKRSQRLRQHKIDNENGVLNLGDGAWAVNTRTVPPSTRPGGSPKPKAAITSSTSRFPPPARPTSRPLISKEKSSTTSGSPPPPPNQSPDSNLPSQATRHTCFTGLFGS